MPLTYQLQPLSRATLAGARRLADRVFLPQRWWERARWALRLSLMPKFFSRPLLAFVGIRDCRYWVAIGAQEEVLGLTGLYSLYGDPCAAWLGWTCVEPLARGKGIGRRLVDFAIEEARRSGAQCVKLYTTDLIDQQIAVQAYERRGFERYRSVETRHRGTRFRYLYYRLPFVRCEPAVGAKPQQTQAS